MIHFSSKSADRTPFWELIISLLNPSHENSVTSKNIKIQIPQSSKYINSGPGIEEPEVNKTIKKLIIGTTISK